jgi:hypothetical protein
MAGYGGPEVASTSESTDVADFAGTMGINKVGSFAALQARVVMLESAVTGLRQLLTPTARQIGPGHNQGPDFLPVPIEDLDEIDHLVALLKEQGPERPQDSTPLIQQDEKVVQIGDRITSALLHLGNAVATGAAMEAGKELYLNHWASVSHWISAVSSALLAFLGLS